MVEVAPDILRRMIVPAYVEDVRYCCDQPISWEKLSDKTVLVTGATGMIGSFLIDVLMQKNGEGLNCKVLALGRDEAKARQRLPYFDNDHFEFVEANINSKDFSLSMPFDYLIHLASTTHPVAYSTDPIGTIESNIMGLSNLLECYVAQERRDSGRILFASSVEVYGENRGDVDYFSEDYCGYIDCNTLRAGYPEAKRLGEALCQAYIKQHGLDVVIPRLPRTYGPTMLWSDTKAISQFIKKSLAHESIVLKSEGTQLYSYLYVVDTVCALLWCLLEGACGEAYNAADESSDVTLRCLAELIADIADVDVVFEIPDAVERAGYSKATKAIMSSSKIKRLGWDAGYDIRSGISQTLSLVREMSGARK